MIITGIPVRFRDDYGVVTGPGAALTDGTRTWCVRWDDGSHGVAADDLLIDVEVEEWTAALDGIPDADRCPSIGYGRRCGLRAGHRTRRHRNCEITWT